MRARLCLSPVGAEHLTIDARRRQMRVTEWLVVFKKEAFELTCQPAGLRASRYAQIITPEHSEPAQQLSRVSSSSDEHASNEETSKLASRQQWITRYSRE